MTTWAEAGALFSAARAFALILRDMFTMSMYDGARILSVLPDLGSSL
jgi:hypothetical protein